MKMVRRSQKPSFTSQPVEGIRQHKQIAQGRQSQVSVTKIPGQKGSRKPGMRKS